MKEVTVRAKQLSNTVTADAKPEPPARLEALLVRHATLILGHQDHQGSDSIFVAIDCKMAGALIFADAVRAEAPEALRRIREAGIERIVMVTGDRRDVADKVGALLALEVVFAELAPAEKVAIVKKESAGHRTIMIGDGVNDAPALAVADIGVAMGARGAAASSQAADVVLLVDRLDRLADAMTIAQRTKRIALQSVGVGIGLSTAGMIAAGFGFLSPLNGAIFQEAIDVSVILNALRALGGRYVA